jgi:hypothetical protein
MKGFDSEELRKYFNFKREFTFLKIVSSFFFQVKQKIFKKGSYNFKVESSPRKQKDFLNICFYFCKDDLGCILNRFFFKPICPNLNLVCKFGQTRNYVLSDNLILVINHPPEYNITSINFGLNSDSSFVYEQDVSNSYWTEATDNICLYKMTGSFPWSEAYGDGKIPFTTEQDSDGSNYFENILTLSLDQYIQVKLLKMFLKMINIG